MAKRKNSVFHFDELWGLAIIGAGVFIFLGLLSYSPNDINYYLSPPVRPAHNLMGPAGAWAAFGLYFVLGFSSYIVPVFTVLLGFYKIRSMPFKKRPDIYVFAWCLALSTSCGLFTMAEKTFHMTQKLKLISAGGLIGTIISDRVAVKFFGTFGAALIMGAICVLSFIYLTDLRLWLLIKWFALNAQRGILGLLKVLQAGASAIVFHAERFAHEMAEKRKNAKKPEIITPAKPLIKTNQLAPQQTPKLPTEIKEQPKIDKPITITKPAPQLVQPVLSKAKPIQVADAVKPTEDFKLPPLDLLEPTPAVTDRPSNENLEQNAKILETALKEFGISVQVTAIQPGPIVTFYELVLAPGTKIGKITALSGDIALAMRVASVRIIAPIPGKSAIGIEVPNVKPRFVYLREVASSAEFQQTASKLPLALGMDVAGNPLIADLAEMPHLLVAGTTGSGKTVCLNTIVLSMLIRLKPDEVKFLMVDPKMVELAAYKNLPHLLVPVIHDPKKASLGLAWIVREMEKRYELFARFGVRNIAGYNSRPADKKDQIETPIPEGDSFIDIDYNNFTPAKLPYIVIIIDELADLMMVAPAEIEVAIARLAQLSRAVGIHIILATQRPSVDVLTGVIKANFSTRISFQVASRIDSRTVLDTSGADMLLGKGDMLFMPPGTSKLIRAQCTLVRDSEINKVVDFITAQKKANFGTTQSKDNLFQKMQTMKESDEEEDPLFDECVDIILATQQASVSILQRKLKIGYNRAARIVDMMEARGIVGPLQDGKREILVNTENVTTGEDQI